MLANHQLPLIPADVLKKHLVHDPRDTWFRSAARLLLHAKLETKFPRKQPIIYSARRSRPNAAAKSCAANGASRRDHERRRRSKPHGQRAAQSGRAPPHGAQRHGQGGKQPHGITIISSNSSPYFEIRLPWRGRQSRSLKLNPADRPQLVTPYGRIEARLHRSEPITAARPPKASQWAGLESGVSKVRRAEGDHSKKLEPKGPYWGGSACGGHRRNLAYKLSKIRVLT